MGARDYRDCDELNKQNGDLGGRDVEENDRRQTDD